MLGSGRSQKLEDMSEGQLEARRAPRAKAVLERGERVFDVELVEVRSCNGGVNFRNSLFSISYLSFLVAGVFWFL